LDRPYGISMELDPNGLIICHGRCVIRGCVPKKILVYGASFRGELEVLFIIYYYYYFFQASGLYPYFV